MQRPDTPDGLFHTGNPATGEKGTPIPVEWLNALLGITTFFRGEVEPPDAGLGDEGDFYICTPTRNMYGPKTDGAWGVAWTQGIPGARGRGIYGAGRDPEAEDVEDGDFWINTATLSIYGPKVAGAWGAAQALRGPQGIQGAAGGALSSVWADVLVLTQSMALAGYDTIYLGDSTAGALVLTLPTAVGKKGRQLYIENSGTTGYAITINAPGGQTLESTAGIDIDNGMALKIYSDGANWRVFKI